MPNVAIVFQGICTHFRELEISGPPPATIHRVVLVNASGSNVINSLRIAPHFAKAAIEPDPAFDLQGVRLSIVSSEKGLNYAGYGSVPSLAEQMAGVESLPPFNEDLVLRPSWPAIAAQFDFVGGTFSACVTGTGAVAVQVLVTTTGDKPNLVIEPLDGSPETRKEIAITSDLAIQITNTANDEAATHPRRHFLLHYLLASSMPMSPQIPTSVSGVPCDPAGTVGIGCSDSNYP